MLGVLKKDLLRTMVPVLLLIPLLSVYWIITADRLTPGIVFMLGLQLHVVTLGSVLVNEQHEDKYHGYTFLQGLPLSIREIVTAKFLLIGLIVAIIVGCTYPLFVFLSGTPEWLALSRVFILANAVLSLTLTGLIYIAIYRFGYTTVAKYFTATVLVIGFILQLFIMNLRPDLNDPFRVIEAVAAVNPLAIIAIGFAIYVGLMQAAIYVRRLADVDM